MGQGLGTLIIAISLPLWASFARIIRGEVLALSTVILLLSPRSRLLRLRIMLTHICRTCSTRSWSGDAQHRGRDHRRGGTELPGRWHSSTDSSLGLMVSEGRGRIAEAWWVSLIPGLAITALVMSVNLFGDWLRDRLDPRLRQL
jgi:peptide/nickel transport system permease protein